jgi:hypothetical protein
MILGQTLPPLVTGELRGEVEVAIILVSLINKSFSTISVSPCWWGSKETDEEISETRLYPPISQDDTSNASLAAALIKADTLAKTSINPSYESIAYPVIADADAMTRYFADASSLTLNIRGGNSNAIIGLASILIGDFLGRGQTSLVGIAQIEEDLIIKGSLVYVLRLRTGRESWLLSERSVLVSRVPSGENSSLTNTEDYLELLKRGKNVINRDGNVRIADREQSSEQESRVNMKDEVKSVLDLDITYPLASTISNIGKKSYTFPSAALEKLSTSPKLGIQDHTSPVTSPPNFQTLSMDFKKSDSSTLLHTSFEVAEEVALGDVHNLLPTPSSVFRKRTTAEEREKKARDLSGGLIDRASRGTSPVTSSSSKLRGTSPSGRPLQNLNEVSSPNSSSGIVSFFRHKNGTQQDFKLTSSFAATAPRLDGASDVIRATERHKVLNGTDLGRAEFSSSATPSQREEQGNFVSSQHINDIYHSEDAPLTIPKPVSGQDSSTKVTKDPSLWFAGISQPGFSRQVTEHSHENVSIKKTSYCSLTQLLSRSSATLKGIDEALVIGANIGGTGSLHSRATFNAPETSLRAKSKDIVASKNEHSDLPISIPSKIAKNLSQSKAILVAYQDITSSLNKRGSSAATASNLFEKTTPNSDIMSFLEGTDERTMAIINETASLSMGEIATFDNLVEGENIHSSQRVNDPLSSVLQKANVDYSRLKSALSTTESALRLPSLAVLGEGLRSLSQRVNGINVDLSAAILFPAATVLSAHQSSGKFGPIALLAVEDEQGNLEKVKSESNQYPRILKQQSAHALQDWLKGCKVWLEYSIPPCATSKAVRGSQFNNETCDKGMGSNEVTEPGETITVSVMAHPVGLSENSHSLNIASNDGDNINIKSREKVMSSKKSTSPTKQSTTTSALPRKSLAPPSGSPLRLERELLPENRSSQPSQKNTVTFTLSMDAAHLLLSSIPNPSLSIPSGYVNDWDQHQSIMTLDSLVHTRENIIRFDDDCLSRWLGIADEEGLHQGQSLLDSDASSSIVVKLYLDASSHEQSLSPESKLSSSESARSLKKPASLQGKADNALPSFASSSSTSSPNTQRVLIGEGKLPLRQLLLSDSLSLDATVDIFNANFYSNNESCASRVCSINKTLATLKQVREQSSNVAVASLGGPVRDSTDVIKSRHETFLSSLSLSSDERQRVQRALAVRTAAVENNPDETKRVVCEALSQRLGGNLLEGASDGKVSSNDRMQSSAPNKSEVVARVRMRVCLLQNTLQRIEVEKNTSSINVVETLRSLPNEAREMKKSQSNLLEGYASLPRPPTFHSNLPPSSLHYVLGADWETLRLPASSFILQSTSDRGRDDNQNSKTSSPQNTSLFSNKVSKLPHIMLGDGNNRDDNIDAVEERGGSKGGASLILSLHNVSSISPRGAFTALGGSSVAGDNPHSNSSIVSLFVRAQPNRAVFSMPLDKPYINVPYTRQRVCTSPTSLPEFRLNSDVILPFHKPSSTDDAEGLATTVLTSNHSGCVLEVYGLIASSDESNESNIYSSTAYIKPRMRLFSQEPILLGTVKVPLEGVADALTLAARSETSLWEGPKRVLRYPKVFDIIHPASADGLACGQLSLTMYAAAHGRQVLVFTGQSTAALEIQKWWSMVVVKARKNRLERDKKMREEEEMEKLKSAKDEGVKMGKGKGKKLQQRVPVNAKTSTSADETSLTPNTKAAPSGLSSTSRAETHDDQVSNHLKFRSLEISPTQTELSSRSLMEMLSSTITSELIPPAILSELILPIKSSELITPTESSKLQSSSINHTQKTLTQNSNPWVIETCISDQMNVMSSQNVQQETQFANSLVDVELALVVDELVTDFFPVDQNSVDANHAFESGDEENVDTSIYFRTHSTEPEIRSSTSNMQDKDHERFKDISVEEAQVSVSASDDIFIDDIATSPTIAIKSGLSCTSNVIHSVDDESKKTEDQVYDIISTIDAEASNGLNSINSLDRDCEHFVNKTLEPERLSFISEVPRLRIDSLQINLSETERMSAALPSSLFGSHHTPKIDVDIARDILAQLAHEQIHKEETVIEEKVKSNEANDNKEFTSLPMNTDKSSESELVNIEDCAKILTSNGHAESTSTINYCAKIDFIDVEEEFPTESHPRLNVSISEVERPKETDSDLQVLFFFYEPQSHPTVDIEIHRDDVPDAIVDLYYQSESEMYFLDFDSVTHAVDACMNDEKKDEDGHSEIQSDCKYDDMDYGNSSLENGGKVMHYDEDDDNANNIPGYVMSTDEETSEEVAASEQPTNSHEPLSKNICIINQLKRFSKGLNHNERFEDDVCDSDEHLDIEDDGEDNQRKLSYLVAKKNYFQYRQSELLENVDVDEDEQEKNSDFLQSQSGSPTSLLELLSYQDEQFLKAAYNDDIDRVNEEVIYDNESSKGGALLAVNEVFPFDIRNVGKFISSNLDQFPPSLTIEQCNSITFSEIEEALAVEESSRAQSNFESVADEDFDMEQLIVQNPQETVSQLLGSTFEEELISAVAVESGSALEKSNSEDVNSVGSQTIRISSSSSSSLFSHVSNNVAVWKDVVAVINQWVENQRDRLISNSDDSIDKSNERDSPHSSDSVEHSEKVNQSSSAIATDDTNTQRTVTLRVADRDSYTERTFERPLLGKRSHLINSDRIVLQGLLHISENVPAANDNHARLREMLGLASSSTLSLVPQHSDFMNNGTALIPLKSRSSYRDIDEKSTPTRVIDVRDTNKLAELLRGVKSR